MAPIKISQQVDAPVDVVFDVFSNIPDASETIAGINKIEMLTDGPVGVGTRWKETRTMLGKECTEEMGFSEFERPNRYVVEAESCGCHFATEFSFREQGGGTQVTMEMASRPLTLMAKLMTPIGFLMKGTMVKCMKQDIADCKQAAEAKSAAASG